MRNKKHQTKEIREKVVRFAKQGFSYSEIGEILKISKQMVYYHIKESKKVATIKKDK